MEDVKPVKREKKTWGHSSTHNTSMGSAGRHYLHSTVQDVSQRTCNDTHSDFMSETEGWRKTRSGDQQRKTNGAPQFQLKLFKEQ